MKTKNRNIKINCTITYTKYITIPESWDDDDVNNYIQNSYDIYSYEPREIDSLEWEYE